MWACRCKHVASIRERLLFKGSFYTRPHSTYITPGGTTFSVVSSIPCIGLSYVIHVNAMVTGEDGGGGGVKGYCPVLDIAVFILFGLGDYSSNWLLVTPIVNE